MTDNNEKKTTLKEAFDAELLKRLKENPPEIPTYEEFSAMIDNHLAKKRRRKSRIIGIAASLAVVILAGILAFSCLAPDVEGDKNPKEEIITEDGVIIEDGGWGSSEEEDNVRIITDWSQVEKGKNIEPDLLIPRYVPEGYAFEKMTIETIETGASTCEYIFNNNENILEIEINILKKSVESLNVDNVTKTIVSQRGEIYIKNNKMATIKINDGTIITIWYELSDHELIRIVEGISN